MSDAQLTAADYNHAFERVRVAAGSDSGHVLTVHMWEAQKHQRREEMRTLLGVMNGEEDAVYCDRGYMAYGQAYRAQRGDPEHGAIGLAVSGLAAKHPPRAFDLTNPTGMLLVDAPPVFVSPRDCNSVYFQQDVDIPKDGLSEAKDGQKPGQVWINRLHWQDTHAGLLYGIQGVPEGAEHFSIDPTDQERLRMAREAYHRLMGCYTERERGEAMIHPHHNEVDVNAKLEHAAAIMVVNERSDLQVGITPEMLKGKVLNTPSHRMTGALNLLKYIAEALKEHELLAAKQREAGIEHPPTLVIYQPSAASDKNRFVHLPPTRELKMVIGELMGEHFIGGRTQAGWER